MLDVARERDVEGDVAQLDLGHGLPIRPGSFDGAISISALQWLCNAVRGERGPGSALTPCCYSHGISLGVSPPTLLLQQCRRDARPEWLPDRKLPPHPRFAN